MAETPSSPMSGSGRPRHQAGDPARPEIRTAGWLTGTGMVLLVGSPVVVLVGFGLVTSDGDILLPFVLGGLSVVLGIVVLAVAASLARQDETARADEQAREDEQARADDRSGPDSTPPTEM